MLTLTTRNRLFPAVWAATILGMFSYCASQVVRAPRPVDVTASVNTTDRPSAANESHFAFNPARCSSPPTAASPLIAPQHP